MTLAYVSPKLRAVDSPRHGRGLVARVRIRAGEVLVVWGGNVLDLSQLRALPPEYVAHAVQIDDDLFLVSEKPWPDADFVNHCCEPNAVLRGQVTLVAWRAIRPGEEITFDYATADSSPYDEFQCHCGAASCRGRVTGDDWRRPDLRVRYQGVFSPYLEVRIRAEARTSAKKKSSPSPGPRFTPPIPRQSSSDSGLTSS